MAVELVRVSWCDPHMKKDEMVKGDTFVLSVNGGKPQEIELCDVHQKEFLEPLLTLLSEDGRAAEAGGKKKRRSPSTLVTPSATPTATVPTDEAIVKCPVKPCPEGYASTRQNMRRHLETEHGTTLAAEETKIGKTLDGQKLKFFCDEKKCGLGFVRAQSLGVHKRRAHGIEGA